MYKTIILLFSVVSVSSCAIEGSKGSSLSLTTAQTIKKTPNEYNITVGGNAFSKRQDLEERTKKEADKVCGSGKYVVKSNGSHQTDSMIMVGAQGNIPVVINGLQSEAVIVCK